MRGSIRLPGAATAACVLLTAFAAFVIAAPVEAAPAFSFGKGFNPATIGPGSSSQLAFRISNYSGSDLANVTFSDDLPAGVVIANVPGATSDCGGTIDAPAGGGTIAFAGGSIPNTTICHLSVNVTSAVAGVHSNTTSTLTWDGGSWPGASADLTVDDTFPTLSEAFSPPLVLVGQPSTAILTLHNPAAGAAITGWSFTVFFPAGVGLVNPQNNCLPTVAPGTSCTITVDVVAQAAGQFDSYTDPFTFSTAAASNLKSGFATAVLQAVTVTQIPTLNVCALIALAGLLLISAGWFLRR